MGTFAQIQDRVLRRVSPYAIADDTLLIDLQATINRVIRKAQEIYTFRALKTEVQYTTTAATRALSTLPTDWGSRRANPWLITNNGGRKELLWLPDEQDAVRIYGDSTTLDVGEPEMLLETPTTIEVYPYSDSLSDWTGGEYRVRLAYNKWLADLVASTDHNWLTDNGEDYIVWAAAGELLFDIPGQSQLASLWALGPEPRTKPQSKADFEFRRVVSSDKASGFPRHLILPAQADGLAPASSSRGGGIRSTWMVR